MLLLLLRVICTEWMVGRDEPPDLLKARRAVLSPPCRFVTETEQLVLQTSNFLYSLLDTLLLFVKQVTDFSGFTIAPVCFVP